ncbi:hypothetical protein T4E_1253, partial [Trichinella pseudospiralis]
LMADDRDVCEEVRIPLNEDQIILTQHVTPMRIASSPGFHGLPSTALMKYPVLVSVSTDQANVTETSFSELNSDLI